MLATTPGASVARIEYTVIERRLMAVLADGRPHPVGELMACLHDDLGCPRNVAPHITRLRRKVRQRRQVIHCERAGDSAVYILLALPE